MHNPFNHIDYRHISGLSKILGIDITDQGVFVVELKRRYSIQNRFQASYHVENAFSIEFTPETSLTQRAEQLKQKLIEIKCKTTYTVSSLQTLGVRTIEAFVPASASSNEEWIRDNQEKLLRVPVSANEIISVYEELEKREEGTRLAISFAKVDDIKKYRLFFQQAGLQLLSLGAGTRDAANIQNILHSLGLNPAYSLSVGLAIKGFQPEINKANFLTAAELIPFKNALQKKFFQRVVLAIGGLLGILLFIPFIFNIYCGWRASKIDEELLLNGNMYAEVKNLTAQVEQLEKQLSGSGTNIQSTNTSRLLYEMASAKPEKLWLYRLTLNNGDKGKTFAALYGYSTNIETVTDFIKNLEKSGFRVHLKRSGNPQTGDSYIPVALQRIDIAVFEIIINF